MTGGRTNREELMSEPNTAISGVAAGVPYVA
jgi:hypothetical protein